MGRKDATQGGPWVRLSIYSVLTVCNRFKTIGEGLFIIFYLCITPVLFNSSPHVKNNITQALAFKMQQLKFPPLRERRLAFIENDGNDKTISIPRPCARGDMAQSVYYNLD